MTDMDHDVWPWRLWGEICKRLLRKFSFETTLAEVGHLHLEYNQAWFYRRTIEVAGGMSSDSLGRDTALGVEAVDTPLGYRNRLAANELGMAQHRLTVVRAGCRPERAMVWELVLERVLRGIVLF